MLLHSNVCLLITQKPYIVSALFPFKEPHQEWNPFQQWTNLRLKKSDKFNIEETSCGCTSSEQIPVSNNVLTGLLVFLPSWSCWSSVDLNVRMLKKLQQRVIWSSAQTNIRGHHNFQKCEIMLLFVVLGTYLACNAGNRSMMNTFFSPRLFLPAAVSHTGRNLTLLELRPAARQKPSAESSNGFVAKNRHPKTRPVKHGVQCHSSGLTPHRNKKLRIRVACLSQHDRSTWSTERKDRCNDHGGTCCNLSAYHPTIGCVVTLAPASLQMRAAARSKQVPRLPSAPDIGHAAWWSPRGSKRDGTDRHVQWEGGGDEACVARGLGRGGWGKWSRLCTALWWKLCWQRGRIETRALPGVRGPGGSI